MTLRCIIIDDESGSHFILEDYISRLKNAELCGKFYSALEAYHFLKQNNVELIFLDINMPQVDGFALLDMLEPKPPVIFTTAYTEYAMKGFDYGAVDYLQKPIRFERFVKAFEKAEKLFNHIPNKRIEVIEIKSSGVLITLKVSEIKYIEGKGNYIKIYCERKSLLSLMTLKEVEDMLPKEIFARIHRSYIVNGQKIIGSTYEHVLVQKARLPIGKTYRKYFSEFTRLLKS